MISKTLLFIALATSVGCASMRNKQNYADYAGQSVSEMKYAAVYTWQRADDTSLVVWTRPKVAFLLTLGAVCPGLAGQSAIEIHNLDGISGRLQAGSGDIVAGGMRCRVIGIQPIDLDRMRRERPS